MRKKDSFGCVEFAVPGGTLEEKLERLEDRGMWLELANNGGRGTEEVLSALSNYRVPIKSVQANLLHELRMLSDVKTERAAAMKHVEETLLMASELGAENVVTTLAYGKPRAKYPRRLAIENYKSFGRLAKELGVTVSIEPLGRNRSPFLPGVEEVRDLIDELGMTHVRLMADTMHIHDNGDDVYATIAENVGEISELQLRDTDSKPPGQGRLDFVRVMEKVKNGFKGLLCIEYKPGKDQEAEFAKACDFVADVISAAR